MKKRSVQAEPVELPPEIWDVNQACKFLKVGKTRLYQLIAKGLPSRKVGVQRRFDPRDVARWWEAQKA